ncbi:MAG: hypothetical protein JKY49_16450 [Cohaesibacteraceae bacterium]|nr:hypothetical protein [Cohaesibacteraceae bacterium]
MDNLLIVGIIGIIGAVCYYGLSSSGGDADIDTDDDDYEPDSDSSWSGFDSSDSGGSDD